MVIDTDSYKSDSDESSSPGSDITDISESSSIDDITSSDATSADTPNSSARGGGAGLPARVAPVVPRLGLRPLSAPGAAAVPRLNIAIADPPSEIATPRDIRPGRFPEAQPSGDDRSPGSQQLALELLSPAFALASNSNNIDVRNQCAKRLGIREDRVRLYALTEIPSVESAPPGCHRLAIEVQGSALSLQAIEDVLAESQRLSAQLSAGAAAAGQCGEKNTVTSSDEVELLRREVAMLRSRLSNSELLRHRGQQALQELKEEFETLHFDLLRHSDSLEGTPTKIDHDH